MSMTNTTEIARYIRGGHGSFTLESMKSGKHLTFRTRRSQDGKALFLHLLTAPETYSYLGLFRADTDGDLELRLTAKSCATWTADSVRGISWLCHQLKRFDTLPDGIRFHHDGTCCRCGRQLTTPESVKKGIGPICEGRAA